MISTTLLPPASTKVHYEALRIVQQVERGDMTGGEIHDMDVIPHPSPVMRLD
jgi:hypothetical protein